ncbi:hypothetical protein AF47_00641, partial [Klebsiella aerogenes MGH 61]
MRRYPGTLPRWRLRLPGLPNRSPDKALCAAIRESSP